MGQGLLENVLIYQYTTITDCGKAGKWLLQVLIKVFVLMNQSFYTGSYYVEYTLYTPCLHANSHPMATNLIVHVFGPWEETRVPELNPGRNR